MDNKKFWATKEVLLHIEHDEELYLMSRKLDLSHVDNVKVFVRQNLTSGFGLSDEDFDNVDYEYILRFWRNNP